LPGLAFDVLDRLKQGRIEVATHDQMLFEIRHEIRNVHRRLSHAVVGAALLMAAVVLCSVAPEGASRWASFPISSWVTGGLGLLVLLGAFAGPRR
jgi:hypothetical protein